ncbi:zinc-binding dehydrogenase [Diaporthe helianthi]|uniref:Zinc-binding dehydrogenase n=1 Tax=Diaporthe helianthi TaxID=158607 RepID=A0A2P5HYW1_DIAHE|nr:zinc-binding dehydrogenase [Diaporthe helianthi]
MSTRSTSELPTLQLAIVQDENGAPKTANISLPGLKPGAIIVKTVAVALNPSDHKMGAAFPSPGAVVGMDFSGIVAAIHPETKTDLKIGDRVCGMAQGSNPGDPSNGAFAQYVRARPEILLRVPKNMSMEEAATLGVGLMTNVMALWDPAALGLSSTPEVPTEKRFPVLVYGGSTATGTLAIQLLQLSGIDPVVTCSPRNFDLVRGRGAVAQVDYIRADLVEEVKRLTGNKLKYAFDCVTGPESVAHCYAALGRTGGRYVSLEMVSEELRTRRAVRAKVVLAYEALGEDVPLSQGYESRADPEKFAFAAKFFAMFQKLVDEGTLKTHPIESAGVGLSSVLSGLQSLKSGSVSGRKLVVTL